ncbi:MULTISPECIES: hypothetical protein [unclassified Archaeoglobus]|jgi:hypothetical protein|uniref:hypothetical protein n=1 Tax=unclassified Archaeoglobus TaxID=2643606 RepID=UPI0025C6E948|nr:MULTISPECIES: hypothetical protein [unclassified Archaeoglobus]
MVLFCGECFHFGYTKYYCEYYDYDGFEGKVDDYGDLAEVYCPCCHNGRLLEVDLDEELVKALKEFDELVPKLKIELTTACDFRDEFSIAKEFSISVLIFAAAGLCKLRIKYYYGGSWRSEEFKEDVYRILERAIKNDLKAVINAVNLLLRSDVKEKVKSVLNWIENYVKGHPNY